MAKSTTPKEDGHRAIITRISAKTGRLLAPALTINCRIVAKHNRSGDYGIPYEVHASLQGAFPALWWGEHETENMASDIHVIPDPLEISQTRYIIRLSQYIHHTVKLVKHHAEGVIIILQEGNVVTFIQLPTYNMEDIISSGVQQFMENQGIPMYAEVA